MDYRYLPTEPPPVSSQNVVLCGEIRSVFGCRGSCPKGGEGRLGAETKARAQRQLQEVEPGGTYVLSKRMIRLYIHNLDIFDAYLSYVRIFERFCPPQPNTTVAPKHGVLLATTMYGWTSYESMLHTVREIGRF